MNNGKLIASIAIGTAIALLLIPKTRTMITDAVSNLSDSLKDLATNHAEELTDKAKNLATT